MAEIPNDHNRITQREAALENALAPGGALYEVAIAALAEPTESISPDEVAEIILPPKQPGEASDPRWQLLEGAKDVIKQAAIERQEELFKLAEELDMRHQEALPESDLSRIDSDKSVWIVEGGANRTSVVRRALAINAMGWLIEGDLSGQTVYQLGSDRPIPQERNDKPNAEYGIAQEIAGDHLPHDDSLTEFGLNLASALQAGFEVEKDDQKPQAEHVARAVRLRKLGAPQLILVQPKKEKGGLSDGFRAVVELIPDSSHPLQPVIATNGQYRPKDEMQAIEWAQENGIDILPPVALGDEPGFKVEHNGREIVTAGRGPMVYVNEAVILQRLRSK
jgi:hypothetical protein